jgi:hypothetical protein
MRKFWKDYAELCKLSGQFYKKHWLGVIILNILIIATEIGWYSRDYIKDIIKSKFKKEEES